MDAPFGAFAAGAVALAAPIVRLLAHVCVVLDSCLRFYQTLRTGPRYQWIATARLEDQRAGLRGPCYRYCPSIRRITEWEINPKQVRRKFYTSVSLTGEGW